MPERFVLIMAGGSGTRLWPASTAERPKHLLGLAPGAPSLLDETVARAARWLGPARIWMITTAEQRPALLRAHPEVPPEQILAEPRGRNTAAAITLGLLEIRAALARRGEASDDATVIALPADHHIGDPAALEAALARAAEHAAARGVIVTLGIEPTRPDTGYGYIERGDAAHPGEAGPPIYPVRRFVEKPDAARAAQFLASGAFLWNAGIFVLPLGPSLAAIREHAPALADALAPVEPALAARDAAARDAGLARAYDAVPALPFDIAVLERLSALDVLPVRLGWNDLGTWAAIHGANPHDAAGNALLADAAGAIEAIECEGSLFWAEGVEIAALGVSGLAVIASGGKILICPLDQAQRVRELARRSAERRGAAS